MSFEEALEHAIAATAAAYLPQATSKTSQAAAAAVLAAAKARCEERGFTVPRGAVGREDVEAVVALIFARIKEAFGPLARPAAIRIFDEAFDIIMCACQASKKRRRSNHRARQGSADTTRGHQQFCV